MIAHSDAGAVLSVIIPAADDGLRLRWCLEGLVAQSGSPPFEVIVVDDGTTADTRRLVAEYARRLGAAYWRLEPASDQFRAAAARNLGVRHSTGSVLVFLDQDVVPDRDYLDSISGPCRPGRAVYGMRRHLPQSLVAPFRAPLNYSWLLRSSHVPIVDHIQSGKAVWVGGYSYAVCAADFCACGGFDEDFVGWGHEDSDLAYRLHLRGVVSVPVLDRAWVTHLDHPPRSTMDAAELARRGDEVYRRGGEQHGVRNGGPLNRC